MNKRENCNYLTNIEIRKHTRFSRIIGFYNKNGKLLIVCTVEKKQVATKISLLAKGHSFIYEDCRIQNSKMAHNSFYSIKSGNSCPFNKTYKSRIFVPSN